MSKFEHSSFSGGYDEIAVSKEKFSKEEALEIAKADYWHWTETPYYIAIGEGYARHRAGIDEEDKPCVGWWLEYTEHKRSCPAWVMHRVKNYDAEATVQAEGYDYLLVE